MTGLRRHIARHRRLATWLFAAVLVMRLLVPGGYMPVARDGRITIAICSGTAAQTMVMTIPGLAEHGETPDHPPKPDMPCAFAGLSLPSLAAADPIVLATALAYIVASAFRATAVARPVGLAFLRPPPRAPPVPS